MKKWFSVTLVAALFSFCSLGYADPSPHDIMQKLAAETFVPVTAGGSQNLNLPGTWKLQHNSNTRVSFTVPYHVGVMGGLEEFSDVLDIDSAVGHVADAFKAELSIQKKDVFENDSLNGIRAVVSGRLGGERWTFVIFAGTVSAGAHIVFYAVAPERWFDAYVLLFDDILKSIHKNG